MNQRKPNGQTGRARTRTLRFGRYFRHKYVMLLRAKGGASKVAKGFSIGLAIEMFTLPTFGLAALLILPAVYAMRASLAGALLGFVFGKVIYIPMAFLNKFVGKLIVPSGFAGYLHFLPDWLEKVLKGAIDLIVGGIVNGTALGILVYFPLKWLLESVAARRRAKRKKAPEVLPCG